MHTREAAAAVVVAAAAAAVDSQNQQARMFDGLGRRTWSSRRFVRV
jgi:hypothetical protein